MKKSSISQYLNKERKRSAMAGFRQQIVGFYPYQPFVWRGG
jgi:hypothetical protein